MESPTTKLFKDRALKYRTLADSEPLRAEGYHKLAKAYDLLAKKSDRQEELLTKVRGRRPKVDTSRFTD